MCVNYSCCLEKRARESAASSSDSTLVSSPLASGISQIDPRGSKENHVSPGSSEPAKKITKRIIAEKQVEMAKMFVLVVIIILFSYELWEILIFNS